MADDLDWLRDRFQPPALDIGGNQNVLSFRPAQRAAVLELVDQAAEVVTGIEDHARQMEARAQFLVKTAVEKLRVLEGQVESAAQSLSLAQSRLATTEAQLVSAEQRAERAEARGRELEYALSRIEDAIRKHLLGARFSAKTAAAA